MRRKRRKKTVRKRSTRKRGRSVKNMAQAARVAQRILTGESQREAARNEGISKGAVQRILSREEFRSIQAEGRSDVLRLVHRAAQVVEHHLKKNDLTAATETLKGTQVFVHRSQTEIAMSQPATFGEFGYGAYSDRSREELEHVARFGHWPTPEQVEVKKETGYWPQELKDGEKSQ